MRKIIFISSSVVILISSCSKNNNVAVTPAQNFVNPETRNQEGTLLLGTSRNNGNISIYWNTFYYEGSSNRILKIIDSSMDLVTPNAVPAEDNITYFQYNASGKLTTTSTTNPVTSSTYIYDAAGRLAECNFAPVGKDTYTYYANGKIKTDSTFDLVQNRCVGYSSYVYDVDGSVVSGEEWSYDDNINALAKTADVIFTYDDKINPYAGIDPYSYMFAFNANPHNYVSHIITTPVGTTTRYYVDTYNSFGLPKKSTWTVSNTSATDKYYYY